MKLFTTEDIRAIERQTLSTETITSRSLVERVAEAVAGEISSYWRPTRRTVIFAGPGNNGADALATAIQLIERGFKPSIYLFNIGGTAIKSDCIYFRNKLNKEYAKADFHEVINTFNTPELGPNDLVIDGLFGSGLREALYGGFQSLVRYINESGAQVVSIDIPSGMFGDWTMQSPARDTINASLTLSIQFPHISFFMPDKAALVGRWKVIDIGLNNDIAENRKTSFHLVEAAEIKNLLKPRSPFCSKADFGSGLLVAGRYGMGGAAVLAARGALRSGIGKLTLFGPQCIYQIAQTSVPEAMFEADDNQLMITNINPGRTFSAYGLGPGLGTSESTIAAVDTFIKSAKTPLVIDADGLNCIARRPDLLNHLPLLSVLTPHEGEFDRLFGEQKSREARLKKALEVSKYYNILILLKGHYTALVRPDGKIYFNSSGSPALATPGAGDVLTGILTSLIAQGYKPEVAAIIAAFIHGRAGEIAEKNYGEYGVTATDIANATSLAIKEIFNSTPQFDS
ncbi:MAG: NAD(P)H-hydrate dehydratase [Bacteroides sp.]|nr:NAD(P)H-hydrate dehydratase [Bacteroides sp.]MCM1413716.1 NAD(P)H-hydrate dehydratase [Bacteroides sp.]MCM1471895.1 NAD(P)H-hydrate dehydratase [Bacteroides sp.]